MNQAQIEREIEKMSMILSIDQRKKNPLVRQYVHRLRKLLSKIRELQKEQKKKGAQ